MKKSKILLVCVLSVILCLVCVMSSTFSWFSRLQNRIGDKLLLPGDSYEISNGNGMSFVTYESKNNGRTYGTKPVTNFSGTINAGERRMFRTDVMNSGSQAQSVSLYLKNLAIISGSNDSFYLGVNSPLKTYKGYNRSPELSATPKSVNKKDVYVAFSTGSIYPEGDFGLRYWGDGFDDDAMVAVDYYHGNIVSNGRTYRVFHFEVPFNATGGRLWLSDGSGGIQTWFNGYIGDKNVGNNDDIDKKNVFFVNVDYDQKSNSKVYLGTCSENGVMQIGAGLNKFYSSAVVMAGSTKDLSATGKAVITYSSSDTSVATVSSAGVVTGVSAGTATITAKSTGSRGDTQESECVVTVITNDKGNLPFVPVVTNVRVVEGGSAEDGSAIESIYWFIKNDSETALTYTVDGLDLTL